MNVQLKDDTQTLDEVVVVAYGTARKSDLTGATASLRPDANDASKTASFNNLLQGKVAGLNVTSSMAAPGAASSVTIRGANSLRGDNQPKQKGGQTTRHLILSLKLILKKQRYSPMGR